MPVVKLSQSKFNCMCLGDLRPELDRNSSGGQGAATLGTFLTLMAVYCVRELLAWQAINPTFPRS